MSQEDTITLELERETARKLDFIIRFCNIIPLPSQNSDVKAQYDDKDLQPAILKIRREIHKKLFPDDHDY